MRWLIFVLVAITFLQTAIAEAENITLDYNQCIDVFKANITDNGTSFYPIKVCSPQFPRINKNIVLTNDNPIYILPDYNFSVKINESVFQLQMDQVLKNTQEIQDLKDKINQLNNKLDGLNNYVNQQIGVINQNIENVTQNLQSQVYQIQTLLRKPQGPSIEMILAIIVIIGLFGTVALIKANIIKLPRYRAPEFQTIEPPRQEKELIRKRLKKQGEEQ